MLVLALRCFLTGSAMEVRGLNARRTRGPTEHSRITTVTVALGLLVALVFVQGWWRLIEPLRPAAHYHVDSAPNAAPAREEWGRDAAVDRDCDSALRCRREGVHQHSATSASASSSTQPLDVHQDIAMRAAVAHGPPRGVIARVQTGQPDPIASEHRHAHGRMHSHPPRHSHPSSDQDSSHPLQPLLDGAALAHASIDAIERIVPMPMRAPERITAMRPPVHRHDLARDHRHAPQDAGVVIVPGRINVAALESLASAFEPGWSLAPTTLATVDMHHPAPPYSADRPAPPRWHGESPDRPPSPLASV
jgi:hypothetical protein